MSFSVSPDAGADPSALSLAITSTTDNLDSCSVSSDGTSGSCSWATAAAGDTAVISVHETGMARATGLQHLTFSQTMSDGTQALAGSLDMTVIEHPVTANVTVSAPTASIGDTVSVTATFVIAPGTPSDYLPSYVSFIAETDPYSTASSLSFALTSFTGASSCQVTASTKGIGCQLDDPQPGDTITVSGLATATMAQLGDSGPSPLGVHHVYYSYGGPSLFAIPMTQTDAAIDVVPASSGGSAPSDPPATGASTTGSSDAASATQTAADPASAVSDGGELAATGSDQAPVVLWAAALVLAGAASIVLVRIRRARKHA
ncbi:LPXTG cell wall anchor domain-containing protein [Rathayibacter sp. CAU 1779]